MFAADEALAPLAPGDPGGLLLPAPGAADGGGHSGPPVAMLLVFVVRFAGDGAQPPEG